MENLTSLPASSVYHVLLGQCPPLRFDTPWGFLGNDSDCRAAVANDSQVLATLLSKFPQPILEGAKILSRTCCGDLRLRPEFCNPVGAVLGFRQRSDSWPHGLLTPRGYIGTGSLVRSMMADHRIAQGIQETRLLFAAFRIREVALLRQLDLPAILCPAFHRLETEQLRQVDQFFAGSDYRLHEIPGNSPNENPPVAPRSDPIAAAPAGKTGTSSIKAPSDKSPPTAKVIQGSPATSTAGTEAGLRPTLVLVGWQMLSMRLEPSPLLNRQATHLAAVRRYLGFPFSGIMVWRPTANHLENLNFRLQRKDPRLARELLLESTTELQDFACFAATDAHTAAPSTELDFSSARANLLAALVRPNSSGRLYGEVKAALRDFKSAVEHNLVAPLRDWAAGSADPVVQNAGAELASLSGLLHRMSPLIQVKIDRQFEHGTDEDNLIAPETFAQYLQTSKRFVELMRALRHWDKHL